MTSTKTAVTAKAGFTMLTGKQVLAAIPNLKRRRQKLRDDLHVAVVSAISHIGEHGDPRVLTKIVGDLFKETPNDVRAVKLFVTRIFQMHPETACFGFLKGEFVMTDTEEDARKKADGRSALVRLCHDKLLNPDGEKYRRYDEWDNVISEKTLNNSDVLRTLGTLLAQARGEKAEDEKRPVKSHVDADVIKGISNVYDLVKHRVEAEQAKKAA